MKFDRDLIDEVKREAPPGVTFEDREVHAALVRAVNGLPLLVFPTAVERAAVKAIRIRREQAPGPTSRPSPVLRDMPEDFKPREGMVWWRCNDCGQGRSFYGTVEQEGAEAFEHFLTCEPRRARTAAS